MRCFIAQSSQGGLSVHGQAARETEAAEAAAQGPSSHTGQRQQRRPLRNPSFHDVPALLPAQPGPPGQHSAQRFGEPPLHYADAGHGGLSALHQQQQQQHLYSNGHMGQAATGDGQLLGLSGHSMGLLGAAGGGERDALLLQEQQRMCHEQFSGAIVL